MTRLAVGRPTLAVSPHNGTKSDLRMSEIKKFSWGTCPPRATSPNARASRALCHQSCAHWNPPFQNPRSATVVMVQVPVAQRMMMIMMRYPMSYFSRSSVLQCATKHLQLPKFAEMTGGGIGMPQDTPRIKSCRANNYLMY